MVSGAWWSTLNLCHTVSQLWLGYRFMFHLMVSQFLDDMVVFWWWATSAETIVCYIVIRGFLRNWVKVPSLWYKWIQNRLFIKHWTIILLINSCWWAHQCVLPVPCMGYALSTCCKQLEWTKWSMVPTVYALVVTTTVWTNSGLHIPINKELWRVAWSHWI